MKYIPKKVDFNMKKLCKYPVRKWKDIPKETQERIRRELTVPLPTHLQRVPPSLKIIEKRKPYKYSLILASGGVILLILIFLLLLLQ